MRLCLPALLCLMAFVWSGNADAQRLPTLADQRILVAVHSERLDAAGPANLDTVDEDLFVTRDGAVSLVSVRRDLLQNTTFTSTFANGVLPGPAFAALQAAVGRARPGTRSGVCRGPEAPLGSAYHYRVAWFGAANRSSRFEVALDGGSVACPPAVSALIAAVGKAQTAALLAPQTTISSSPCTSDRQCPSALRCCYPCGIPGCLDSCSRPDSSGECPRLP